jgi:Cation efflux system protein CusB domain 1
VVSGKEGPDGPSHDIVNPLVARRLGGIEQERLERRRLTRIKELGCGELTIRHDRLKPGQKASLSVDALPGRTIDGTVVGVAPASGSVFSLLPPDNATGNFTRIVQRVPVRIEVPVTVTEQELLRPGMSVVVRINTKAPPSTNAASSMPATNTAAR